MDTSTNNMAMKIQTSEASAAIRFIELLSDQGQRNFLQLRNANEVLQLVTQIWRDVALPPEG